MGLISISTLAGLIDGGLPLRLNGERTVAADEQTHFYQLGEAVELDKYGAQTCICSGRPAWARAT
jgi:hypothetical protein